MSSSETALQGHRKIRATSFNNCIPSQKDCFGADLGRPRHATETLCPDGKVILLPVLLESRQGKYILLAIPEIKCEGPVSGRQHC